MPQPDFPTRQTNSPASTLIETPFTTSREPYFLLSPSPAKIVDLLMS